MRGRRAWPVRNRESDRSLGKQPCWLVRGSVLTSAHPLPIREMAFFQSSFPMSVNRSHDVRARSRHCLSARGGLGRLRHGMRTTRWWDRRRPSLRHHLVSFRAGGREADGSAETSLGLVLAERGRARFGGRRTSGAAPARFCGRRTDTGGSEESFVFAIKSYHFDRGARRCWIDQRHFRICTCGEQAAKVRGMERNAVSAAAILDQRDVVTGEVSASNSDQRSPSQPTKCVPLTLVG